MNNETKNEVKKNVATGASTAVGATAGVVIGTVLSLETASAQEIPTLEPTLQPTSGLNTSPKPEPAPEPVLESDQQPTPHTQPEPTKDEIEVIGYDRVTNEDGSQNDVAVLNVNGNEVGVVDVNLDGEADAIICDANQNGVIEEDEMQIVQGEEIAMQPFADAAGFNPQYAQNDLPDYVNDADVDTYMA